MPRSGEKLAEFERSLIELAGKGNGGFLGLSTVEYDIEIIGRKRSILRPEFWVTAFTYSKDGRRLAAGAQYVWRREDDIVAIGILQQAFPGESSADPNYLFGETWDKQRRFVKSFRVLEKE